jgi:hypothetical protein
VRIRLAIPALILSAILILPLSTALAAGTLDQEQPTSDDPEPGWLFTQTAEAGRLEPLDDGAYQLMLRGVDRHTIAFTDRPGREASIIGTGPFIAAWGRTFATSAPNAALVEHEPDGTTDTLVVTLSDPAYDPAIRELRYRAVVLADELHPERLSGLGGERHGTAPALFGAASLFIDSAAAPSTSTCKLGPGGSCAGLVYRYADLSGLDLSGIDLTGADLTGTKFIGTNLNKAKLTGATLTDAVLTNANLSAYMGNANLTRANLAGVDLRFAYLGDTDFTGADLRNANFGSYRRGGEDVIFVGSDLSGANFGGAKIEGVLFTNANLTNAKFNSAHLDDVKFGGARVSGIDFTGATLAWTSFKGIADDLGWALFYAEKVCRITLPDGSVFPPLDSSDICAEWF